MNRRRSGFFLVLFEGRHSAELSHQRRVVIVFDMPTFHDAPAFDPQGVDGPELDRTPRGGVSEEGALVSPSNGQARDHPVAADEQVFDGASQIRDRPAERVGRGL